MMAKMSLLGALAVLLVSTASAAEVRHSGTVVHVAPDGRTIVLEEMVAWTGPGTGVVRRTIEMTAGASVHLVRPSDTWDSGPRPGYTAEPIRIADLRPGDFVTVAASRAAGAVALEVVRPEPKP